MKIKAESFLGRVLAVFSRRSPGFHAAPEVMEPLPELGEQVAHARYCKSHGWEDVCVHSGDTLRAALRDATSCAGIRVPDFQITVLYAAMTAGSDLAYNNIGFVAKKESEELWGIRI